MFSKLFSRLFVRGSLGILLFLVLQAEMKKLKKPDVKTRQGIQYSAEPVIGKTTVNTINISITEAITPEPLNLNMFY